MGLRAQLSEMMTKRPAHYRAMLDELASRLHDTALDGLLKVGDPMPEFVLPNAEGELVFSDELLARGPLVVVLVRGDWCPFCTTTLAALNAAVPEIEATGAGIVALTPDTGDYAARLWRDLDLRFPVLSDVDGATALQLGAVYSVPDGLRTFWKSRGIDMEQRHGDTSWLLPMPSTFITDSMGVVRYAFASGDVTDRVEPAEIVTILRDLAARA